MSDGATGGDWDRAHWLAFADRLLAGGRAHLSPHGSQIAYPGGPGGYGAAVDGLEGFTRTLLIAGFRIAGERGVGVDDLIDFCCRGITAGVDPGLPDRWVRLTEHPQAKVEAASVALILDLTRPWVWDRLDAVTQARVIDYFAPVVGDDSYPKTNWLWFRVVVETFLRSVGGPWSHADIESDLALHESLQRPEGWISDGVERSYDHYVGWALHLYPVLWSRMTGAAELADGRTARDVSRLDRYLQDAVALVGADGSPLMQGRSLIYRFAAAAPFWAGVIAEVPSTSAGLLRHAASRMVEHFAARGVPNADDVLSIGWHGEWLGLAQSYSGPGSPYWAAKGLLGISLPADHPVWAAPAEPLPVESGNQLRAIAAPGWIVSSTRADGIVRVINHGTDHAIEGVPSGDSPLYARLGYSTATSPLIDDESWTDPLDQSVVLLDRNGRATHRSGMTLDGIRIEAGVGIGSSTWDAHWLDAEPPTQRHGSGWPGTVRSAGRLTVSSLVRGPWEMRVIEVDSLEADADVAALRVGGWPIAGGAPVGTFDGLSASAVANGTTSSIRALDGDAAALVESRPGSSPLGTDVAVPVLHAPAAEGSRLVALVALHGDPSPVDHTAAVEFQANEDGSLTLDATWPDGLRTTSRLTRPRTAVAAARHPDRAQ